MQNAQNTEIQQRVINLVNLYRTKVGKESQAAKNIMSDREYLDFDISPDPDEELISQLKVNEQLLGHFYAEVAGENADKDILEIMLTDFYDKTVFADEEELFLKSHFKEMVNYIVLTPENDCLERVNIYDWNNIDVIPNEVIELIDSRTKIAKGSKVFYPNTGYAQLVQLYEGCKFYCNNKNAWMQIVIYANKVDAEIMDDGTLPTLYDSVVSYLPSIVDNDIELLCKAYENLPLGGQFILLCHPDLLVEHSSSLIQREFRERLVKDKAIAEIIQLPPVMHMSTGGFGFCLLIAEKKRAHSITRMINSESANIDREDSLHFLCTLDNKALDKALSNDGTDPRNGCRCSIEILSEQLRADMLIPRTYSKYNISENESPVFLDDICTMETTLVRDIKDDMPLDTPWVKAKDLSYLYKGELDVMSLERANCQNSPKDWKWGDRYISPLMYAEVGSRITKEELRISEYRKCTYLDGTKDAVLFYDSDFTGFVFAILPTTGNPVVVDAGINVVYPKEGYDALTLLSVLRLPEVHHQISGYNDIFERWVHRVLNSNNNRFYLKNYMNDIIVPSNGSTIYNAKYQIEKERHVIKDMQERYDSMKTEYINEVRMRKHDMGQKVFDLINTEDLMRYYVENRESECDLWPQLEEQLDHFRSTIHKLSEMLEHLSQEEQFGSPELIDLDEYLKKLHHSNNVNGYTLSYRLERDNIVDFLTTIKRNSVEMDKKDIKIHPTVWIAMNDFERIVSNILNNAQKHGFIDARRQDYEVNIRLTVNIEKRMYQIDFRNNGHPLPKGIDKMRYGIKGEKAGITAGTGLGGSVVKSIVYHYKGDYDIFMDGEWTVVRVYLPIAI